MTSENAPSFSSRSSNGSWQPPALEEIQALFPQYEIVALLGRGGMGAVYKGWQRSLDRFVAIKILPPGLTDDPQYSERFKQEAKSMAKLAHAGIVAVFDAGELANGMLYFVMEFIEGTDVQKMIAEQGSLPPAHAMAITAHVCDALQYAHDRGIIHRDIKPANIMVGYDGVVKVADFGLAKQQQEGVSGLTQSGMVMGTLHYMAPESLILGVSVDHRADIYAVGIMLYQMLTGRLPQGLFEMPSQKVPGLDPRYDAVIAKAIREDRDIRYQSAAELRADLDSILTQPVLKVDPAFTQVPAALPTVARPQRPQGYVQRAPQPVQKKSSSTGILLVAVLVLAAGGFFVFKDKLLPAPAPTQPVTAETPKAEPATAAPSAEEKGNKDVASTTPASPTAKPASMPVAVPKTEPVTSKPVAPPTDLEKRIASLETGFQNAAKAEPEQVFQQSMAALNKSYLAALDRSLATATQKGELDDAVALREEKQRMEKGSAVPSLLEESTLVTPVRETVKKLRDTYRATQLQHATTKAKAIAALYDKYDQALVAIQTELTKVKKLDEALTLRPVRDELSRRKAAVLAMQPASAAVVPTSTAAVPSSGFTNSLGMKFVPVPNTKVHFCIHETRRADYAAYAKEVAGVDPSWQNPVLEGVAIDGGDDHPVVAVNWEQAKAFCDWLSCKEGRKYRLPTDREWSFATGIGALESANLSPGQLKGGVLGVYPWGKTWPLPEKCGNYADTSTHASFPARAWMENYTDGFPTTAPVMSFKPNDLGIYDLGGNVWEWCEDRYSETVSGHVLRGGCWDTAEKNPNKYLLASFRLTLSANYKHAYGFRCVWESAQGAASVAVAAPSTSVVIPQVDSLNSTTTGFTNSLGMKFVPVPDTDILMCIHETRYGDYAAYAAEAQDVASDWMKTEVDSNIPENLRKELPATVVSWEDTKKFCAWLSKRESRLYRLPTDAEWSIAVGLGHLEKRTKDITPEILNNQEKTIFPWEGDYPPRDTHKAGNFADMTWHEKKPDGAWIDGYNDGYVGLAPVMSFKPNKLGIYDLGGNAWEWVEDRWNNVSQERVLRGAAFYLALREHVRASNRVRLPPGMRAGASYGFRVVLKVNSATAATMPPAKPATTTVAVPKSSAQPSAQDKTFANSLGMKFVPVPGTQILLCAHETRRADYAAYAAETPAVDASWKDQKEQGNPVSLEDACPVVAVSWNDAQAFCEWLSKKEGRTYRLPTELEWSHAAGIGPDEERIGPARTGGMNVPNTYPWGNSWPPPAGAGNYADEKVGQGLPGTAIISGYADGYLTTAPVMQFKPNALGIYDLGGNVKEWCADRWSEANTDRIVREGDWAESRREYLLSSARTPAKITTRSSRLGFRCALVLPADTAGKPPAAAVPAVSVPAPVMPPAATIAPTVAGTPAVSVNGVPEMVFFETKGQVKVIGPDGKMSDGGVALSRGAEVTTLVVFGSTVKTGAASSADLALSGGGSVRLDADTELKLSGAVNGSNAGETLELVKGRLFLTLDSEDLAHKGVSELKLKTPAAALDIKGGKCYVEIGPKFETMGVFKGDLEVTEASRGGKMVLRDEMGISVKPGALSPPQRLSSSQAAFAKACDEIELVRMETDLRDVDTLEGKVFEDTYFFPNTSEATHLTAFATLQRTALPNRRTKGALVSIKPNDMPNARGRTVSYRPQVEVPRAFSKVVAIENSYRGDGIVYFNTSLSVLTEGLDKVDALPSSVRSDRVFCTLGNGGMGDWRRNMYPFLADVVVPGTKLLQFGHHFYPGGKNIKIPSVVTGRNECRLEMGPVVIIVRKR